ncbi:DUF4817 domain-containing protein [Trichonephila clavipes]|nr:DUF4817 domain-containing protein [Trichonephila clavipes]
MAIYMSGSFEEITCCQLIFDISIGSLKLVRCCQVIYSPFGSAIHQNDHQARRRFVERAQNEIAVVPDFHERILFSYEVHFYLNGYVNKQNCRIWSEANPQVYVETPLHQKTAVWCALWAGGILLQKAMKGHNVTVNGDRFWTCELAPPRSCDLTPLDYFLWGYIKSLIYTDKPQTPDRTEDNIRRVMPDILAQMLEKSSKIGRPDWTTSEPAVAVLC